MTAHPERKPDALDLAEQIDGFARELRDASTGLFSGHQYRVSVDANIDYARDVAQRLTTALDAYEARI